MHLVLHATLVIVQHGGQNNSHSLHAVCGHRPDQTVIIAIAPLHSKPLHAGPHAGPQPRAKARCSTQSITGAVLARSLNRGTANGCASAWATASGVGGTGPGAGWGFGGSVTCCGGVAEGDTLVPGRLGHHQCNTQGPCSYNNDDLALTYLRPTYGLLTATSNTTHTYIYI